MDYKSDGGRTSFCLECGDEIHYGRPDRKFCCENCKNAYHNRKARNSRITRLKVMHALDKNHGILEKLLKLGIDSIDLLELKHLGFDMSYSTSYRRVRCHDEYCCFDIRYIMTPTKICAVSKVQSSIGPEMSAMSAKKSVNSQAGGQGELTV